MTIQDLRHCERSKAIREFTTILPRFTRSDGEFVSGINPAFPHNIVIAHHFVIANAVKQSMSLKLYYRASPAVTVNLSGPMRTTIRPCS
jgi:hypothetical protein